MTTATLKADTARLVNRKATLSFALLGAVALYLIYIFFSFDIMGLSERASLTNAKTLVADSYSYKTHITKSNRGAGNLSASIEGEKKGRYPEGTYPDWVSANGSDALVTLSDGSIVELKGKVVYFDIPNYGPVKITTHTSGIDLELPTSSVPDFISASRSRVAITTVGGRVSVTKSKTEIFRYFTGWEMFFFTLDSPFYGKSASQLAYLATSAPRLSLDTSNFAAMWDGFWNNAMWRHGDVAWAIFETILMAFLGTAGAALIALPLAFLSAQNFTKNWIARFSMRRTFDFLRGVDGLIWTIILSRAFGPGPLTGALAILLTDTGTFGKMFSETLENVDDKQIEGIRSTGAKPMQRYRFGVIPQITPVFISQVLYYFESNTRSATIIGAIVGGGIGLLLTQAIITGKDWEEVTYYIILIIIMVMMMDTLSGWLRSKLIGNKDS
nr:phosphonate ABC transporter, permease protein PhnE [Amylibacter sp.]